VEQALRIHVLSSCGSESLFTDVDMCVATGSRLVLTLVVDSNTMLNSVPIHSC
jgi:hypothetical protein